MDARALHPSAIRALSLLGAQVKEARLARRWTAQELADRAGITRSTLRKIENGDPGVAAGSYFEAAALTGLPLFSPDPSSVDAERRRIADRLALLPARVDRPRVADNDF